MSRVSPTQPPPTLDLQVLRALAHGPAHGCDLLRRILDGDGDAGLGHEEGRIYPVLHRMESWGWLEATWQPTEHGRRARVYTLTADGQRQLEERYSRGRMPAAPAPSAGVLTPPAEGA